MTRHALDDGPFSWKYGNFTEKAGTYFFPSETIFPFCPLPLFKMGFAGYNKTICAKDGMLEKEEI